MHATRLLPHSAVLVLYYMLRRLPAAKLGHAAGALKPGGACMHSSALQPLSRLVGMCGIVPLHIRKSKSLCGSQSCGDGNGARFPAAGQGSAGRHAHTAVRTHTHTQHVSLSLIPSRGRDGPSPALTIVRGLNQALWAACEAGHLSCAEHFGAAASLARHVQLLLLRVGLGLDLL